MRKFNFLTLLIFALILASPFIVIAQETASLSDSGQILSEMPLTSIDGEDDEICISDVCVSNDDLKAISQIKAFSWLGTLFKWLLIIGLPFVGACRWVAAKVAPDYSFKGIPVGKIVNWVKANIKITRKKK